MAVLVAAVGYVLVRALVDLAAGNPVDWTGGLPPVLLGGLAGVLVPLWWQRRRAGGWERAAQVAGALRAGRVPSDADSAIWRPLLERERRARRRALVVLVPLAGGLVALVAVVLARAAGMGPLGWALAVAGGVLVVASVWRAVRERAGRIESLLDQLSDLGRPEG